MAKPKKKLLPKDFEALLKAGQVEPIKAVFVTCDVNARGGYTKQSALAFNDLPDEVARWLVENGADISATDSYGETPLHSRSGHWQGNIGILLELGADVRGVDSRGNTPLHDAAAVGNAANARTLIDHGAPVDAINKSGLTPLGYALQRCTNNTIDRIAGVSELLLQAQSAPPISKSLVSRLFGSRQKDAAPANPQFKEFVERIGTTFEFHRSNFNPQRRDETSAALDRLYALFDVPPVPRRVMHDGKSAIVAKAASWQDKHQELWELLVPPSGAASTVQGEAIRISGRVSNELESNGGINWDADFKRMTDALLAHLGSGTPLPANELKEAGKIVSEVKRKFGDTERLCELAVDWVELNPKPVPLPKPAYDR